MRCVAALIILFAVGSLSAQTETDSTIETILLQKDGKIIAAGTSTRAGISRFVVARYQPNGVLDEEFGVGGIASASTGRSSTLFAATIASDGKIVAAGYSDTGSAHVVAVARFAADGKLDASFGKGGWVTAAAGLNYARAFKLLIQPDGKLLAIGHSNTRPAGGFDFLSVRFNADGSLDRTFGTAGIVQTRVGMQNNGGQTGALQPDGKFLVAGQHGSGTGKWAIARYLPNGRPDLTFGVRGLSILPVDGSVSHLVVLSGDKIILIGYTGLSLEQKMTSLRLDGLGKLDTTYGSKGVFVLGPGDPRSVWENSNGTLLVTGESLKTYAEDAESEQPCFLGYSLDPSAANATRVARIADEEVECSAHSVAVEGDGKMVFGASSGRLGTRSLLLLRFKSDGSPDLTFGTDGKVITGIP